MERLRPRRTSATERPSNSSSQQPPTLATNALSVEHSMSNVQGSNSRHGHDSESASMPTPTYDRPASRRGRGHLQFNRPNVHTFYEESKESDMLEADASGRTLHQNSWSGGSVGGSKSSPTHANVPAGYEQFSYFTNPLPLPSSASTRSSRRASIGEAAVRSTHLRRQNVFSKGIDLRNLDHPSLRRDDEVRIPTAVDSHADSFQHRMSAMSVGVVNRRSSAPSHLNSNYASKPSLEDVERATLRLRDLCMRINQDGYLPERSEIKQVVAEYHQSRQQPLSPSDPNFVAIPSKYSKVLTYGMARSQSQCIPQSPTCNADAKVSGVSASSSQARSKFAEIKDEGDQEDDLPLNSTIALGCIEDEVSCLSFT